MPALAAAVERTAMAIAVDVPILESCRGRDENCDFLDRSVSVGLLEDAATVFVGDDDPIHAHLVSACAACYGRAAIFVPQAAFGLSYEYRQPHLTSTLPPMSTSARRRPKYVVHDDFRMPMGFPVQGFSSGLKYRPLGSDVFVASYPKCGTTWMQYIVYLLMNGARALPPGRKLEEFFPHLEEVGTEGVQALPERRMIKTHLPFEVMPFHSDERYLYVALNSFDCAVKY